MTEQIPVYSPEKREIPADDNARKFVTGAIDPEFLRGADATVFLLITDWLQIGNHEIKLVCKKYENGNVEYLRIEKIRSGTDTKVPPKQKLTPEQYHELLETSELKLHAEKVRHEFTYSQNGIDFSLKYDVFVDSILKMLEVDAASDEQRLAFDDKDKNLPFDELQEVTGKEKYYGYQIVDELQRLKQG